MKIDSAILYGSCPCGSGKKFKFCCLPVVRDELPGDADAAEVVEAVRTRTLGVMNAFKGHSVDDIAEAERTGDLGAEAFARGRLEEAIALFRKAHGSVRDLFSAWNNESLCHLMLGDISSARECVENAIASSPDANAFGWATKAIIANAVCDEAEYEAAIARAKSIKPLTAEFAVKVCEALAVAHRDRELLDYAQSCGFDANDDIAYMAGVAAANLGERGLARKLLDRVRGGRFDEFAGFLLDDMEGDLRYFGLFDWLYFSEDNYPCGLLSENLPKDSEFARMPNSAKANAVCHRLEIDLARDEIEKADALKILSEISTPRAAKVREHVEKMPDERGPSPFDRLRERIGLAAGSGGGVERRLNRLLAAKVTDDAGSLLQVPENDPEYKRYVEATEVCLDHDSSHPKWEWAKKTLLDFNAKHPYNPRALMNYCGMLSIEGRNEEAFPFVRQLYEQFPNYAFAVANWANAQIAKGDVDEAERVMDAFCVPDEISPEDCATLLKTEAKIATERKLAGLALRCMFERDRIEKEFGVRL